MILGVFASALDVGVGANHVLPPCGRLCSRQRVFAGLSAALASALALQVELSSVAGTSALLRVVGVLALVAWRGVWPLGPRPWAVVCWRRRWACWCTLNLMSHQSRRTQWCGVDFAGHGRTIDASETTSGWACCPSASRWCSLRGKPDHPCGSRFVDAGSGHCHATASPVGAGIAPVALRPAAASGSGAFGIGFTGGSSSSRQDLQLKSNLVADPRGLHDQLLVLNPYGRAPLTVLPKPDGKRGTSKGHENFGNGVWPWTMPSGIRPESCRPANVLKLKSRFGREP